MTDSERNFTQRAVKFGWRWIPRNVDISWSVPRLTKLG